MREKDSVVLETSLVGFARYFLPLLLLFLPDSYYLGLFQECEAKVESEQIETANGVAVDLPTSGTSEGPIFTPSTTEAQPILSSTNSPVTTAGTASTSTTTKTTTVETTSNPNMFITKKRKKILECLSLRMFFQSTVLCIN